MNTAIEYQKETKERFLARHNYANQPRSIELSATEQIYTTWSLALDIAIQARSPSARKDRSVKRV
jgi:hypothetical protein